MKKLIIILTFLCSLQILRAEIILDSEYETYEQLLDDTIFDNTSTLSRIAAMKRRISSIPYNYTLCQSIPRYNPINNNSSIKKILILCQSNVYSEISDKIIRYAHDIHKAFGCSIILYSVNGGNAQQIKNLIISNNYDNLSGTILIGNFDSPYFIQEANPDSTFATDIWTCDLFYMDLDGVWLDSDGDDIYDSHIGNIEPEIFVSRISTHNYSTDKISLLSNYLDKNHDFWNGNTTLNYGKALAFITNDWSNNLHHKNDIKSLYGSRNTDIISGNDCTWLSYKNCLASGDYEFIQISAHSNYNTHTLEKGTEDPEKKLLLTTLSTYQKNTLGYNLYCCRACRWNVHKCLGESYLYDNSSGLVVVGSTKTGSMLGFSDFYTPLGNGEPIGVAFKSWWINHVVTTSDIIRRIHWYYGMCILGDPLISFHYENNCPKHITISALDNYSQSHFFTTEDSITASFEIPIGNSVELTSTKIILKHNFHANSGSHAHFSVDPCKSHNAIQHIQQKKNDTQTSYLIKNTDDSILTLSPNPATNSITISGLHEDAVYCIYNLTGEKVRETTETTIDISALPAGMYVVIATTDGKTYQSKFIKE